MEETTTTVEETEETISGTSTAVSNNLVLKWIRFENFRRFKEADIPFEREGFTGITGENGAGKSSLMIGLIFALYGKFPDGVRKSDLRYRGSDLKKEPTVVSVGFEHHGQTVEVVRKLTGGNSTATAEIFLDGKQVTVATGGTATDWVANRLGMDEEGFKTAVVVPQQELNKLVTARASERREIIEKLAGIEDMNRAVKNARSEENDLVKTVKILPGDPAVVAELTEQIEAVEESMLDDEKALARAKEREDQVREDRNRINAELARFQGVLQQHSAAQSAVNNVEHQMEIQRMSLSNLRENTASLRSQYPQTSVPDKAELDAKVRELREEYKTLDGNIKGFYARRSSLESELSSARQRVQSQEKELSSANTELAALSDELAGIDMEGLGDSLRHAEEEMLENQSTMRTMRSKKSDIQESLATLRKHTHDAQCPTCNQELADPAALIRSFEDLSRSYDEKESAAQAKVRELDQYGRSVNDALNRARGLENQISQLRSTVERLEAGVSSEQEAIRRAEAELSSMDSVDVQSWETRRSEVTGEGHDVSQRIEQIQKITEALRTIAHQEQQATEMETNLLDLEEQLSRARHAVSQVGDVEVARQHVDEASRKLPAVDATLQDVSDQVSALRVEISKKRTSLDYQRKELTAERHLIEQKNRQLEKLSLLTATTSLLDEFRKDRISRIAPELSSSATEMISSMTDGAFIEVTVSDDFSTNVINAAGETFSVSELSGGERSVVALCLRIAISSLINNENSGLMWFDEALTEQDAKRRAAILNVLRSLPIQQIIMINHTHDAEDIVDKTIRIIRSEDASTVEV